MNYSTYTQAIENGLYHATEKGYTINVEEVTNIVGFNSIRPKDGKTTKISILLYKNDKLQKKALHIQVYGRGTLYFNYELNYYIL